MADEQMGKPSGKKRGRRSKTSEQSRERVSSLLAEHRVSETQRLELLSVLSEVFCEGRTASELRAQVSEKLGESYQKILDRENLWDLLREAAAQGLMKHKPRPDLALEHKLVSEHPNLEGHLSIVQTASTEALAGVAAQRLLEKIREVRHYHKTTTVHVGFAGGMTLRTVAKKLAELLHEPHPDNPKTLVFHAMVASFDDDDFFADPNSFITYFIRPEENIQVRLVRLPLPGIMDRAQMNLIHSIDGIENVFQRRKEIQIVVTSGSLWSDEGSTLHKYMEAAFRKLQLSTSESEATDASAQVRRYFSERKVIGDLLWQPISDEGLINLDLKYVVTTLMSLNELPEFIQDGGTVLLVMGCSGISGNPKSKLLNAILKLQRKAECKWITDVVTDTPTARGVVYPNWDRS